MLDVLTIIGRVLVAAVFGGLLVLLAVSVRRYIAYRMRGAMVRASDRVARMVALWYGARYLAGYGMADAASTLRAMHAQRLAEVMAYDANEHEWLRRVDATPVTHPDYKARIAARLAYLERRRVSASQRADTLRDDTARATAKRPRRGGPPYGQPRIE